MSDSAAVNFIGEFDANGKWKITPADFNPIDLKDYPLENGKKVDISIFIHTNADAKGVWLPADKASLMTDLIFSLDGIQLVLRIAMDTQKHELRPDAVVTGKALDPVTGAWALAGIGTLNGQLPCALQLDGLLTPPLP